MQGIKTRYYYPKSITDFTTSMYNLAEALVSSPSSPNRQDNRPHFLRALWRFQAAPGKSLMSKYRILPSYLNLSTLSKTFSCAQKSVPSATRVTFAHRRRHFLSAPLLHILVLRCPAASFSWGKNISHWPHWGWGPVPLLRIIVVYSKFQCIKFSHSFGAAGIPPRSPLKWVFDGYGSPRGGHPVFHWLG